MIKEFEPSEFIATIIAERSNVLKNNSIGTLSFNRLFAIKHRVEKINPFIRIRINSESILSFCSYLNIECKDKKIKIKKMSESDIARLKQYMPIDKKIIQDFISANY